jgi:hypothetical protein
MYKVVKLFTDLQDSDHLYEVGDEYPRFGLNPDLSRITELPSDKNKRGIPLIELVDFMNPPEEPLPFTEPEEDPVKEEVKPKKRTSRKKG